MKQIISASILLVFVFSLLTNNAMAKGNKNEKTITFKVSMDCHSCVKKIEGNISYEKGVKDLKVSLDDKECEITYRTDKTNSDKLIKAFSKLGYTAKIKKEENTEHNIDEHEGHNQIIKH